MEYLTLSFPILWDFMLERVLVMSSTRRKEILCIILNKKYNV